MQSNLTDIYGAQPEQLSSYDTFINYTSTGIIPGAIGLPLQPGRAYIFTKIKTCISLFTNLDRSKVAFPNFEQFNLPLKFKADITDAVNQRTKTLFTELRDVYTNGDMHAHTFETPFTILADQKQGSQILVTVSCELPTAGGLTETVGSISTGIPTAPLVDFADGLLIFEGYSFGISEYNKLKEKLVL